MLDKNTSVYAYLGIFKRLRCFFNTFIYSVDVSKLIIFTLSVGFEVSSILTLLDKFCEEKTVIGDLEQEIKSSWCEI